MRTSLVLTVIGDDKPGIVEQISDRVAAAGANWEESSMARLAGKFAGLLRVSVPSDRADALATNLRALSASGLAVVVEVSRTAEPAPSRHLHLSVVGNDRPGIVRDLARTLAGYQVNIEALDTSVTGAPMSGEPLFRADASLRVPAGVTVDQLRLVLEALASELMVDLTVGE
ncbi:MAG: ACT domain-containing protein [Vicinamibacterales bacterium]